MIKIAICDDEKIYLDLIHNYLTKICRSKSLEVSIYKYYNPNKLIQDHSSIPFDVLFLDIDMPVTSGFDISKSIRETSQDAYIIFVSAKHELVYNSFEYTPFYFICKTTHNNLLFELEHVMDKLYIHYQQHRKITINDTTIGSTVIRIQNIIYIKSDKHYLLHYVTNKIEPYIERATISQKMNELECPDFLQPHQRYLVNMNHIHQIGSIKNIILLDNSHQVPISKSFKQSVLQKYLVYKRR